MNRTDILQQNILSYFDKINLQAFKKVQLKL